MASFLSRLFGGGSDKASGGSTGETVEYSGFAIRATPIKEGGQWRLAGMIIKSTDEGDLERTFLRADLLSSREDAESSAINKGKQIIDEQGAHLFADGEKEGRA